MARKEHEIKNPCYPNRKPREKKPANRLKQIERELRAERRRLGVKFPGGN